MQYVIIDPNTLIFDKENLDKISLQSYIDRILETCDLDSYGFIQTLISESTIELLISKNDYPEWDVLTDTLALYDLHRVYQSKDIINALERILKNPTVEDMTDIKDVLFSIDGKLGGTVDVYLQELERLYVYCYLNKIRVGPTLFKGFENSIIEINCEIIELDSTSIDLSLPLTVKERLEVIGTLESLLLKVDVVEIWRNSSERSQLVEAINLYLVQNKVTYKKNWRLGEEFINLIETYGFMHESYKIKMLLRAICEVIGQTSLVKTHALRESESGASQQIKGKNGKAFRHDIDRDFHLHYWRDDDRLIFASAGPHNNFYIPDR